MMRLYKVCPVTSWDEAERTGRFVGSASDLEDGFIHLSRAGQVAGTLARHFAGQADLVVVAVDAERLGAALRWEPSRGGELFPHVYGDLPVSAAVGIEALPLGADGVHILPTSLAVGTTQDATSPVDLEARGWRRRDGANYMALIGPIWTMTGEGEHRFGFLAEPRHLNNSDVVHGGMLMSFADQALGMTAWAENGDAPQVTIQLDTQFISGARAGELVEARCRVVQRTASLMFMAAELSVGARLVATATGIWKLRPRRDRAEAGLVSDAGR